MFNKIQIPKTAVISGVYALAMHGVISYTPSRISLEMPQGTNTSAYPEFNISVQSRESLDYSVVELEGLRVYSLERLFVELDKIPLENTILAEAIRNLETKCNPAQVKKIYEKLKRVRRGIDDKRIIDYLQRKYDDISEVLLSTTSSTQVEGVLREYIIYLVSSINIPVLIKGGSSVELFSDVKRSTKDVDAHSSKTDVEMVIEELANNKHDVWFELTKESKELLKKDKLVYKLSFIPKTRRINLNKVIENKLMEVSLNTTFDSKELSEIINDYKLSKQSLKILKSRSCITFSREMLLAEKLQSLISKPEDTSRTKDLIDLHLLWGDINKNDFRKWFFRKWEAQRESKSKEDALAIVKVNKDKALKKVESNFARALGMYNLEGVTLEDCLSKYRELIEIILTTT